MVLKSKIKMHLEETSGKHHPVISKELFELFHRVLNQSETFIVHSIHHFDQALKVAFRLINPFLFYLAPGENVSFALNYRLRFEMSTIIGRLWKHYQRQKELRGPRADTKSAAHQRGQVAK